jgi:hypothetical protein
MTTTSRNDCGIETLALLRCCPDARGIVGTCIVCGGRSPLTLQPVPGLHLPWNHHVWAIGPDGVLIDPTVAELMPKYFRDFYEPPAPLEQLKPQILWNKAAQDAAMARLRPLAVPDPTSFPPFDEEGQLLYLPGRLAPSRSLKWQRLARKSQGPNGFSAADLAQVLTPALTGRRLSPRADRGFAREVTLTKLSKALGG